MNNCKIIIAGGSGFIGQHIAKYFAVNNKVIILTRLLYEASNLYGTEILQHANNANISLVKWNMDAESEWQQVFEASDIVINLAGKTVNCRYTSKNKNKIFSSRVNSTKTIAAAINKCKQPPKLWLNASSATIYRHATDTPQDELTGEYHDNFSVQVCKLWEKTFFENETTRTRKIALRMAITLGEGGVIIPYLNLCKYGLSGKQGNGNQMFSWIHIIDICRAIDFMHSKQTMEGVYNLTAPQPLSNKHFMQKLRTITGNKFGLPAPAWLLKLGALFIGTETELILKSRWVLPTRLLQAGFLFKFNTVDDALQEIIAGIPKHKYRLF